MRRLPPAAPLVLAALAASSAVPALSAQQAPAASATIYTDGRVLVRRTVPLELPRGSSTQRVALGPVDPASIFPLDAGVTITGLRYDEAVDEASVLRRAVGQRISFRRVRDDGGVDTASAVVLGADPVRLLLPDGRVTFQFPGTPLYPAAMVVAEPTAELSLRSADAARSLRLGYFTHGSSWEARYNAMLARGGQARVSGHASVHAGTLRLDSAEVQLLAGDVGRALPPGMPVRADMMAKQGRAAYAELANAEAGTVGDFHLYTLPGRHTLLPAQTTTVGLFDPVQARYEKRYVAGSGLPRWGIVPQQSDTMEVPVEIRYTFDRPRGGDFGRRALPGGVLRIFEPDSAGRVQLVGEARIDHTPAGEDVDVAAGSAFDLTAKRVQTAYSTRQEGDPRARPVRTIATASYSVVLANASDTDATVHVREERGGEWSIVQSSVEPVRVSSDVVLFPVRVPANGSATLTYTVRAVW
jgi:hypothetical protein